jgi:hypothetical protein
MIRFLLHWITVNVISYSAYCGGMTWKAIKEADKEYDGNESWSKGKKETIQTFIICITIIIIISCLIS